MAAPQETGRRRAHQGMPLPEVLQAYRISFATLWDASVDHARRRAAGRASRAIGGGMPGTDRHHRRPPQRVPSRSLSAGSGGQIAQEPACRSKERHAGDGPREIENPVMQGRRINHEHPFQHLFDDLQVSRVVTNEVRSVLAAAGDCERHVVAQDVMLALGILNGAESFM